MGANTERSGGSRAAADEGECDGGPGAAFHATDQPARSSPAGPPVELVSERQRDSPLMTLR